MSRVGEQMKVLSIFHYIVGALYGLYFLVVGVTVVVTPMLIPTGPTSGPGAMPAGARQTMVLITGAMGGAIALVALVYTVMTIWSGICIAKRRRRHLSLVMASVNLLAFPFGTALGIFAFVLLRREDTVWWYAHGEQHAREAETPACGGVRE